MDIQHRIRMSPLTVAGAVLLAGALSAPVATAQLLEIPREAIALEGIPTVRIDSTEEGTTRQVLGPADAAANQLRIRVIDGTFYWASRDDQLLRLERSDEFTYLTSEPGKYIKVTRMGDRLSYVEHLETKPFGSITWWGELRVVLAGPHR
jgi:hypothetical protein